MLADALAKLGPAPFLTHYDSDSRIELSGVTFANWVAKTANLFEDLGGDPDEPISLGLAETHPGHWVTIVWTAAAWLAGTEVIPGVAPDAAFAVVGPGDARRGVESVACSLHPLGRGFETPPAGATDYFDVFAQPDAAFPADEDRAPRDVLPRSDRKLFVNPAWSPEFVADVLLAPMLGGGSSVVAVGLDEAAVERIRETERVTT